MNPIKGWFNLISSYIKKKTSARAKLYRSMMKLLDRVNPSQYKDLNVYAWPDVKIRSSHSYITEVIIELSKLNYNLQQSKPVGYITQSFTDKRVAVHEFFINEKGFHVDPEITINALKVQVYILVQYLLVDPSDMQPKERKTDALVQPVIHQMQLLLESLLLLKAA